MQRTALPAAGFANDRAVCSTCGYPSSETGCDRCHGAITGWHGQTLQARRGLALLDFAAGFWSLFAGALALFTRPEFAGKLRVPFLANLVVLTLAFFGVFFGLWELFEWALAGSWGWFEFLRSVGAWATGVAAMVLAAIALFFVAPVLIETVMGPFLDPLADVTEKIHGGSGMRAVDPGLWRSTLSGLRSSAQILTIQLVVLPLALVLSLTGIGALLAAALAAILNAIVWFDIPLARRGQGLPNRLRLVRRNWPAALGFGFAFQVGLVIPLFNFLLLTPAAAVAVSSLYFRFEKVASRQ